MKKILVLGATGLLGAPLSIFLTQQGYDVIRQGFRSKTDYQADLRDRLETEKLLNNVNPNFIINLIALTDVDRCEEDPHMAYMLNVRPVENLLPWLATHPSVKLLHISTDHVYDGAGPHKENDVTLRNLYAFSKYCSEQVALRINACVLRTNFFGKSLIPSRFSFSDWLINSLKQKSPIKLFTDVYFSPLSIETLQKMILLVVENHRPGVFNLGSHNGMSKCDFGIILANHLKLGLQNVTFALSADVNLKAYRPTDMRVDCTLFETTFGVKLPTLSEEIKSMREG